jgi:UDP-N-acetylmuramate--alanine ligase
MKDNESMHIYFSGVGGFAIGPLAILALETGHTVSGSDLKQSEMLSFLRDRGARMHIGQDGTQIANEHIQQPIDWFVHSSAITDTHPELIFAREHGIKISKRSELINQILKEKNLRLLAISGTHGKTTTTAIAIWLFVQLGIPVSYSLGSTISYGLPAHYEPGSEYFVYECDEFDRNFLDFYPSMSAISSLSYDHADTYPNQADYDYAFTDFVKQSTKTIMWQSTADHLNMADQTQVDILSERDPSLQFIQLPGKHVRRNAWLAAQLVMRTQPAIRQSDIFEALARFPGVSRRFEKLGENLYTDYAHHPDEIAATLQLAHEVNKNVVVVYQPHQNVRQHEIMSEYGYAECFESAKQTYFLPTFLSREDTELPVLSQQELIDATSEKSAVVAAQMDEDLWEAIQKHREAGDLVLIMSAGDMDHWLRQKVSAQE